MRPTLFLIVEIKFIVFNSSFLNIVGSFSGKMKNDDQFVSYVSQALLLVKNGLPGPNYQRVDPIFISSTNGLTSD